MRVQVPSSTPKVYKLKESGAAPLAPQQRNGIYFGLWKEVESLKLGIDRFALTSRTLGCVPKVAEMTDAQFRKITSVFAAIVRDANPPTLPNL
ncbi:MAG: hypothetical protein ABIT76_08775 [Chthoniobacterales bacterium]